MQLSIIKPQIILNNWTKMNKMNYAQITLQHKEKSLQNWKNSFKAPDVEAPNIYLKEGANAMSARTFSNYDIPNSLTLMMNNQGTNLHASPQYISKAGLKPKFGEKPQFAYFTKKAFKAFALPEDDAKNLITKYKESRIDKNNEAKIPLKENEVCFVGQFTKHIATPVYGLNQIDASKDEIAKKLQIEPEKLTQKYNSNFDATPYLQSFNKMIKKEGYEQKVDSVISELSIREKSMFTDETKAQFAQKIIAYTLIKENERKNLPYNTHDEKSHLHADASAISAIQNLDPDPDDIKLFKKLATTKYDVDNLNFDDHMAFKSGSYRGEELIDQINRNYQPDKSFELTPQLLPEQ